MSIETDVWQNGNTCSRILEFLAQFNSRILEPLNVLPSLRRIWRMTYTVGQTPQIP